MSSDVARSEVSMIYTATVIKSIYELYKKGIADKRGKKEVEQTLDNCIESILTELSLDDIQIDDAFIPEWVKENSD